MTFLRSLLLTGAAAFALAGGEMPALAAPAACDTMMTEDTMMAEGDATMKDDAMMGDDAKMAEGNAMTGDAMMEDGAMAGDGMAMMADYTVSPGDSLWSIAESQLCDGNRFHEIAQVNADTLGPDMMVVPGQVLHIPGD